MHRSENVTVLFPRGRDYQVTFAVLPPHIWLVLVWSQSIPVPTTAPHRIANHYKLPCHHLQIMKKTQRSISTTWVMRHSYILFPGNAKIWMHFLWVFCKKVNCVRGLFGANDLRTKVEVAWMLDVFELLKIMEEVKTHPHAHRPPATAGPSSTAQDMPA